MPFRYERADNLGSNPLLSNQKGIFIGAKSIRLLCSNAQILTRT